MARSKPQTVERATNLRDSAEMHREIYRAIRARKAVEASRLMEQHLRMAQAAQGMERPVNKRGGAGADEEETGPSMRKSAAAAGESAALGD